MGETALKLMNSVLIYHGMDRTFPGISRRLAKEMKTTRKSNIDNPNKLKPQIILFVLTILLFILIVSSHFYPDQVNIIKTQEKANTTQGTSILIHKMPSVTPEEVNSLQSPITPTEFFTPSASFLDDGVYPNIGILIRYLEETEIHIVSSSGKLVNKISLSDNKLQIHRFFPSKQPCNLMMWVSGESEDQIVRYNISKKQFEKVFTKPTIDGLWLTNLKISPDEKWISYSKWSGYQSYDSAETQDLEVVALDENKKPLQLTRRGGDWKSGGEWSSTENRIAFSDNDKNDVSQLYVWDIDHKNMQQYTDFTDKKSRIGSLSWSPKGNKIAFYLIRNFGSDTEQKEIWVVDLQERKSTRMNLPVEMYKIGYPIIWDDYENRIVLFFENSENKGGLSWLDSKTGQVIHSMKIDEKKANEYQLNTITFPVPITKDTGIMGFLSKNKLYFYDAKKQEITPAEYSSPWQGLIQQVSPLKFDSRDCK